MTSELQNSSNTEVRESEIELKWKIRLFWILLCIQLASAVVILSLPTGLPHHRVLGFLILMGAVGLLLNLNELRKRRIERQSEVQHLEGDGGRQRT